MSGLVFVQLGLSDRAVMPGAHGGRMQAQEMTRKRRYGRLQKAMGDMCLLAGSAVDATEHYATAVDLSRMCSDTVWCGAALSGLATAKVPHLSQPPQATMLGIHACCAWPVDTAVLRGLPLRTGNTHDLWMVKSGKLFTRCHLL